MKLQKFAQYVEATTGTDQYSTLGRNNLFGQKKNQTVGSISSDEENIHYTKKPINQNKQTNPHRQDQYIGAYICIRTTNIISI